MRWFVPVIMVLGALAYFIGRFRNASLAKHIGREITPAPSDEPVLLLEKLQRLYESGALTDAEYRAQKARILNKNPDRG